MESDRSLSTLRKGRKVSVDEAAVRLVDSRGRQELVSLNGNKTDNQYSLIRATASVFVLDGSRWDCRRKLVVSFARSIHAARPEEKLT